MRTKKPEATVYSKNYSLFIKISASPPFFITVNFFKVSCWLGPESDSFLCRMADNNAKLQDSYKTNLDNPFNPLKSSPLITGHSSGAAGMITTERRPHRSYHLSNLLNIVHHILWNTDVHTILSHRQPSVPVTESVESNITMLHPPQKVQWRNTVTYHPALSGSGTSVLKPLLGIDEPAIKQYHRAKRNKFFNVWRRTKLKRRTGILLNESQKQKCKRTKLAGMREPSNVFWQRRHMGLPASDKEADIMEFVRHPKFYAMFLPSQWVSLLS